MCRRCRQPLSPLLDRKEAVEYAMSHEEQESAGGRLYSYEKRKGILPISWQDYFRLYKGLALAISAYEPEIILGIARGRLYAATLLSHRLEGERNCYLPQSLLGRETTVLRLI
jgi:hypothetical protein